MDRTNGIQDMATKSVDQAARVMDAWGKGVQALTIEMATTSQKGMSAGAAFWRGIVSADSLDQALAIQSEFARQAYETGIGHATRVNTLLVDMARGTIKPFETLKP